MISEIPSHPPVNIESSVMALCERWVGTYGARERVCDPNFMLGVFREEYVEDGVRWSTVRLLHELTKPHLTHTAVDCANRLPRYQQPSERPRQTLKAVIWQAAIVADFGNVPPWRYLRR